MAPKRPSSCSMQYFGVWYFVKGHPNPSNISIINNLMMSLSVQKGHSSQIVEQAIKIEFEGQFKKFEHFGCSLNVLGVSSIITFDYLLFHL